MFIAAAADYEKTLARLNEELSAALTVAARIPYLESAIRSLKQLAKPHAAAGMTTVVGTDGDGKELELRAVVVSPAPPTMLEAAETVLREFARPMHIREIVVQLHMRGVGNKDKDKLQLSLTGSLDRAVAKKRIFRKTQPGYYDLLR